ncbi:MAG: tetratricopeptide repeat protein [Bryobacteraceae bacterium]
MKRRRLILALIALLMLAGCKRSAQQYVELGNKAFESGLYEDAAIQFQNAIRRDPNSGEAYFGLGMTALRQDKAQLAFQGLSRAVALAPDHEPAKVALGNLALSAYLADTRRPQALYDQIAKLGNDLLARNPSSIHGLRFKAHLAMTDRKPAEAIALLRQADAAAPLDPLVAMPLAQSLLQDNQVAEAEAYVKRVIAKHKDFSAIYDLLYVYYLSAKKPNDAEAVLRTKVANMPNETGAWIQLISHLTATQRKAEGDQMVAKMLENPKSFVGLRRQLGDYYASRGTWPEALKQFELGAAEEPKEKLAYQKRLAAAFVSSGRKEEALAFYDTLAKDNPADKEVLQRRAALRLENGDRKKLEESATELAALAKQHPGDAELAYDLGRLRLINGDLEGARSALSDAVRRKRGFTAASLLLAEVHLRNRQPKDAQQQADAVLAAESGNRNARLIRVMALLGQQQLAEARGELTRLIKDEPDFLDAQLQLGLLALAEKKYSDADRIFERFYKPGQGDLRPLEGLVASHAARNQFEEAIRLLTQEVKSSGNAPAVRATLAATAVRAEKYDLALAEYQKLGAEEPANADIQTRISEVQQLKGDMEAAVASARRALELAPKSAVAEAFLAQMLDAAGKKQDAAANYRHSLELQPDNPEVLNNLAFLLAESGQNLEDALKFAQRAQRFAPDSIAVADTIGFVYLKKGMPDPALQIFANLTKKHPDQAVFHYRYAMALVAKGDRTKAQEELQKALDAKPSKADEAQIRQLMRQVV